MGGVAGGRGVPSGDDSAAAGGGAAKLRYYGGSTLSLAGEHEGAEAMAMEAISMYEASPPAERSYGDEALARVDVVTSRLVRGTSTAPRT